MHCSRPTSNPFAKLQIYLIWVKQDRLGPRASSNARFCLPETRFDIDTGAKEFSINLYPQQKKLNDAILDTVKYLNWTRYAIIYEGNKQLRPSRAET